MKSVIAFFALFCMVAALSISTVGCSTEKKTEKKEEKKETEKKAETK